MWLKLFSTKDRHYLYATESNEIFQIGSRLFEYFNSTLSVDKKYTTAAQLGLVSEIQPSIGIFDDRLISSGLEKIKNEGPTHLALSITEACNFRCRYCAYSGVYDYSRQHSSKSMSAEMASKAINWYFNFPRKTYHIGFYGGEPLLKFRLIQQLVEEARERLPCGTELTLGMTTNGGLLNDTIDGFLAEHRVDLFISLDGPREHHDRYRVTRKQEPSFSTVWKNIQHLREKYPEYYRAHVNFSITLVPPTLPEDVQTFLQQNPETFGKKVPKLGTLNTGPSKLIEYLGITSCRVDIHAIRLSYLRQMVSSGRADEFSRASAESTFTQLHNREMGVMPELVISAGQCVPGMRCYVTIDGKFHMCEHGDEHWPIGDIDSGLDFDCIRAILKKFHTLLQTHCENCWAVRLCRKCIPQLAEGPTLPSLRLAALCRSRQHSLEQDLIDYCEAREQNPHCFNTLAATDPETYY